MKAGRGWGGGKEDRWTHFCFVNQKPKTGCSKLDRANPVFRKM